MALWPAAAEEILNPCLTKVFREEDQSFPVLDEEPYSPSEGGRAELRALRKQVLANSPLGG